MKTDILCLFILISAIVAVMANIKCDIGWGQRGLLYKNGISWERTCLNSRYCFEAITYDIEKVVKLIDYPWDPYYKEFYVKGCGGSFGTPLNINPYKGGPQKLRKIVGSKFINITTPVIVTGHGGKEEFILKYHCRKDLCKASRLASGTHL